MRKIKSKTLNKVLIWSGVLAIILFLSLYTAMHSGRWGTFPNTKDLQEISLNQATLVYTADGKIIGRIFSDNRIPVSLDSVSPWVIKALIATEDQRFYDHNGTDYISLLRVGIKSLLLGDRSSGGGSTLSQQLVKNLYPRKGSGKIALMMQKIREASVAGTMEQLYEKEEILELYLNTVPFSDNTFGIETASRHFFNCRAADLDPAQAATLVGMLKATHTYNPRLFPERSKQRRDLVLQLMADQEVLDPEALKTYQQQHLDLKLGRSVISSSKSAYFIEKVKKDLRPILEQISKEQGKNYSLDISGLQIVTTLDSRLQQYAEESVNRHMKQLQLQFENGYGNKAPWNQQKLLQRATILSKSYQDGIAAGGSAARIKDSLLRNRSFRDSLKRALKTLHPAFVAIDPGNGAVLCWVGGNDFYKHQYDHVYQSRRQVGSVFKPLVYAAALESGIAPCTHYPVRSVTYQNYEGWTPENASSEANKPYSNYSMAYALKKSLNTISVKVLEDTGLDAVIKTARDLGIEGKIPEVPSIALGTATLSVLEMAEAYTAFAGQGKPIRHHVITEVRDREGNLLWKPDPQSGPEYKAEGISEGSAILIRKMLEGTVTDGTAAALRSSFSITSDLAAKTGTTQDNQDGWFAGIMPKMVSVAWVGTEHQYFGFHSTALGQGARSAMPITALWLERIEKDKVLRQKYIQEFDPLPEDLQAALDCPEEKRDGFFKRLFSNPEKQKKRNFRTGR